MNKKTTNKYWAEIEFLPNNKVKLVKANKLVSLNQYKNVWTRVDARNVARLLNRGTLVIN